MDARLVLIWGTVTGIILVEYIIHYIKFSYNLSVVSNYSGTKMKEYSILYFICIISLNNSYGHLYMLLVVFEITLVSHTYTLNIITIMILSVTPGPYSRPHKNWFLEQPIAVFTKSSAGKDFRWYVEENKLIKLVWGYYLLPYELWYKEHWTNSFLVIVAWSGNWSVSVNWLWYKWDSRYANKAEILKGVCNDVV
jgi:hypothetical protein